ncbi:macro domain protein [Vibrio phage 1.188.A._10N.286.51.A6]|uniref:Macro domain protein n=3 Tax=Mukerjeevirus mv51A6 TaxID=2734162 RepID=A0A2I7RIW4_9CAUD|nr:macro domain protein [Vibrio phage 1.188.A._10N.286.51.A6]AUR93594.1 macro domain protein [Vibrio phage 1.188.A._10N.286.51.A6]AUR93680.1 macro domain protein [Vibrio phage 1.188.B._10N.286.51.A6]AUR93766.1 macro domain protein [Vibrio phage 1.188.C._10N.286.51.A6]
MIVDYVKGDLVTMLHNAQYGTTSPMVMVHGCNCQKTMGAGIARQLANFCPAVENADKRMPTPILGTYSVHNCPQFTVINMYTQAKTSRNTRQVNYAAVGKGFMTVNDIWQGHIIYIPRIGAGLGLGNWEWIEAIINDATPNIDIVVVDFAKGIDPRL